MNNETTKEWIVVKEGIIESIITDTFSFGVMATVLFLNYKYLGNQSIVTWFLLIIWLLTSMAKGADKYHSFKSTKEAVRYLEKL